LLDELGYGGRRVCDCFAVWDVLQDVVLVLFDQELETEDSIFSFRISFGVLPRYMFAVKQEGILFDA
jgi:hypothetical protein